MADCQWPSEPIRLPDDIPFERWVGYVFDRPVLDEFGFSQHAGDYGAEVWWDEDAAPARTLEYLTRLFRDPSFLLDSFTREQIDTGLDFLVSNSRSNHMFTLTNETIPWSERRACFEAMIPLYENLMARVYGDTLGHLSPAELNFACYMWWDIIPLYGGMDHPDRDRINDAVLYVFDEVLKLTSEACLESVLHGLGHWTLYVPKQTRPVIDRFLRRHDISPPLRRYAQAARTGNIQ